MPGELAASTITTEDLVLTPTSPQLATALVDGDFSAVTLAEGWPHEDSLDGLTMVARGRALGWLITLDGLVVGECGTHAGPVNADGLVEIGYGLAAPYRGRGYGRQTVRALSQWLLAQPGVTGVLAHTDPANTPSRRSLESAGFRLEGEDDGECRYVLPRP
jgi:RimJ/RimL family protein N-acetyltransferase